MAAVMAIGGVALLATGPVGWAAFAAGTMVVSGVMARKAEIDGNKDAAGAWMAIGTIASVGYGLAGSGAAEVGASQSDMLANQTAGMDGIVNAGVDSGAGIAGTTQNSMLADQAKGLEGVNTATKVPSSYQDALSASEERMAKIMSNNLKVQSIAGGAQALVGWQASETAKETAEKAIAEQRRITERDYANKNNLTGLKVQTPTNLPNLMAQAKQKGLINAAPTAQVVA